MTYVSFWYVCSLGICDDLINFLDESMKNKMAAAAFKKRWPPKKVVGMITYWFAFKFGMVVLQVLLMI